MRDRSGRARQQGLSMIEIMIVVTIVGLLAVIAVPAMQTIRRNARNTAFINDLRTLANNVFYQYALSQGNYPPEAAPGVLPPDVAAYMPARYTFSELTPIGGNWDWDRAATPNGKFHGCYAGLSVHLPSRTTAQMTDIDTKIDDGNLATGTFRSRANGYIYILEP